MVRYPQKRTGYLIMDTETKHIELDSMYEEDFEKICDAVALEMELGCPHIIVTLRGTEKTILEINHKKIIQRGYLRTITVGFIMSRSILTFLTTLTIKAEML